MTIDFHLDAPAAACCFKASALSGVLTVDAKSLPELEDKIRDVVLDHYAGQPEMPDYIAIRVKGRLLERFPVNRSL